MNKLSKIALSLLTVAALSACSETIDLREFTEETYPAASIYISPYGYSAYADIGLFNDWELTDIPDWLTVTPTSGKAGKLTRVEFSASAQKYEYLANFGHIDLRINKEKYATLGVHRYCPNYLFKFDNKGETKVIENWHMQYDWEITECPSWLNVSPNKGKADEKYVLTLRANSNASANPRQDLLRFTFGDYKRAYYVSQCTDDIDITPDRTYGSGFWDGSEIYYRGSSTDATKVTINSTADWTAETTREWINLSQKSGKAGKTEIIISTNKLDDDSGSASIKFKIGDIVLYRIVISIHY